MTDKLLTLNSKLNNCNKLCVDCYEHLLEDELGYEVRYCNFNKTVREVAEAFADSTLLIRVHGHLTCSINGIILDTWDCSNEKVDKLWIVS